MMNVDEKFVLSQESKAIIDKWVNKYPEGRQQSAIIEALFVAQKQNNNWLSKSAMKAIAEYLKLPEIVVYEAATFYDMFNLKPIGKHKVAICTNISCMLRGSDNIVSCLEKRLKIKLGETTKDGLFTLKEVECMAACAGAPMCQINDKKYYENLTPDKILNLIDQLEEESHSHG